MSFITKKLQRDRVELSWKRLMFQGFLIILLGIFLVLACLFSPANIVMSAREFSWLPLTGMVILVLGLEEILEAYFSKDRANFQHNIQVGIYDIVFGALIILSISGLPARLDMMVAAFLIVRGSVRVALVHTLGLPHKKTTSFMGIAAITMGLMITFEWPGNEGWFLALCLSLEILFRGWATIIFSLWVKQKNTDN